MTRVSLVLLLVACGDAVPEDEAHTCVVTRSDEFGSERWVSTMFEPGKPTRLTWYRDDAMQAHWEFTYDAARRIVDIQQTWAAGHASTRYEHTPTTTTEIFDSAEQLAYTIDAQDHITRIDSSTSATAYQLEPSGAILRTDVDALDEFGMRYQHVETNAYENGRLVARTSSNTLGPGPSMSTWTYEERPQELVVRSERKQWTYSYDADGRAVRAVEADPDGADPWTKELVYAPDGAVEITGYRDGPVGTTTLSAACGFRPVLPAMPRSGPRPGTRWMLGTPSLPNPY